MRLENRNQSQMSKTSHAAFKVASCQPIAGPGDQKTCTPKIRRFQTQVPNCKAPW
jgi:hypothetical protein